VSGLNQASMRVVVLRSHSSGCHRRQAARWPARSSEPPAGNPPVAAPDSRLKQPPAWVGRCMPLQVAATLAVLRGATPWMLGFAKLISNAQFAPSSLLSNGSIRAPPSLDRLDMRATPAPHDARLHIGGVEFDGADLDPAQGVAQAPPVQCHRSRSGGSPDATVDRSDIEHAGIGRMHSDGIDDADRQDDCSSHMDPLLAAMVADTHLVRCRGKWHERWNRLRKTSNGKVQRQEQADDSDKEERAPGAPFLRPATSTSQNHQLTTMV
jgi:hypothetical protein